MSFENFQTNLQKYEKRKITLNDMYELIDLFMRDVREHNFRILDIRQDSIEDMEIDHDKDNVIALFDCIGGLLDDTIYVIKKDASLLDDKDWEKDLKSISDEAQEISRHIEELKDKIKSEKKKRDEVELHRNEEDKKLKSIIAEAEKLSAEIKTIEDNIKDNTKKKEDYEELLKKLRTDSDGIEDFEARYAILLTAFNSLFSDEEHVKNVFSDGKVVTMPSLSSDKNIEVNASSVSDIIAWCKNIEERIETLLSVYQHEMTKLIGASESKEV